MQSLSNMEYGYEPLIMLFDKWIFLSENLFQETIRKVSLLWIVFWNKNDVIVKINAKTINTFPAGIILTTSNFLYETITCPISVQTDLKSFSFNNGF